jgi:hypothetical protein
MSDVEVAGNGSVLWRVKHGSLGRPLKYKPGNAPPDGDEVIVTQLAEGKDALAISEAGVAGPNGRRYFTLSLRYDLLAEAQQLLAEAQNGLPPAAAAKGPWIVELKVPIVPRMTPDENPPWEIKVHW